MHSTAGNKNSRKLTSQHYAQPRLYAVGSLCGRNSYVEITGSWPCLHKTLSGAGRWNRANFALTEFYEVCSHRGCAVQTALIWSVNH